MPNPTVSFVVPCYKLSHFLPECIGSILSQTYRDFEVLIMDDCSPDETAAVAASFKDERVRYVRNPQNLGPLRNYNRGILLSSGKYVWLISADDYLRRPYVLERYLELMENNPRVGYTFCPGVGVRDGKETQLLAYSRYARTDQIVDGQTFLKRLLKHNMVLAASAMVRRECYQKVSMFPVDVAWAGKDIDMVWGGDWYLWCAFALAFQVGYFAEPMVCYREHDLSMTNTVTKDGLDNCLAAELAVLWLTHQRAQERGSWQAAAQSLAAVAREYGRHCVSKEYRWLDRRTASSLTMEQFEEMLCRSTDKEEERRWIRARVFESLGDNSVANGEVASARRFYLSGLRIDRWMPKVYAKLFLLKIGKSGEYLRKIHRALRSSFLMAGS